ncbi:MAG: sulfatase [Sedimentisphaeraceae bacterium JB056]
MSNNQKTNIVFILTDHFRPDAVCSSTPNLEKLASKGVLFTNAYCASPLCQPARTSIATGKFPSQTGICGNQSPPVSDSMRDDTYINHLQNGGYCTALIGKHHFIDRYGIGMDVRSDKEEVQKYGFDYVLQVLDDGENTHNKDNYTAYLEEKGLYNEFIKVFPDRAWQCKPHPFDEDDTVDGFIGNNAIKFITDYSENKPFYLNVGFVGPHPPFWHPGQLKHKPENLADPIGATFSEEDKIMKAHFMDRCSLIDKYIGKLVDALKQKGIYENTLIVFSSDHGEMGGDFGIWDKRFCYEQSWGVPLIISGSLVTGQQRKCGNRVSKSLVSHLDLYPTFLHAAGITPSLSSSRWGKNIFSMLDDQPGSGHEDLHAQLGTVHMMRNGNWKISYDPEAGGVQYLFNLRNDPKELCNLAGVAGYENITSELLAKMLNHRIRLTQFTQVKEEQRVQDARTL